MSIQAAFASADRALTSDRAQFIADDVLAYGCVAITAGLIAWSVAAMAEQRDMTVVAMLLGSLS